MSRVVLYLIDTLEVGGTERSILEIAARLQRFEPRVCRVYPGDALDGDFEAAGIDVSAVDQEGRYAFLSAARKVEAEVRAVGPVLIHSFLFRAGVVARLVGRRVGIPVVDSFVNDSYSPQRWRRLGLGGRLKLSGVRRIDAWTARYVTRFMAVSEAVRRSNAAALGIDPERIDVIHRGRDPSPFATLDGPARRERRAALGLEPDDVLILNVSRLLERKGQAELIDAHQRVVGACPRARLWIAGAGPERGRLEARIAAADLDGHIRLLGTRDDVPELLQLADVFVLPSHYEGHSGALVEAMMAGLPIVASDTPTNRESVEPERTARLAPIGDSAKLAEAVLWMLDRPDRGAALGAAARATAVERFDIREVAARHEALYDRVLAEASGAGGRGEGVAARGG